MQHDDAASPGIPQVRLLLRRRRFRRGLLVFRLLVFDKAEPQGRQGILGAWDSEAACVAVLGLLRKSWRSFWISFSTATYSFSILSTLMRVLLDLLLDGDVPLFDIRVRAWRPREFSRAPRVASSGGGFASTPCFCLHLFA